MGVRYVNFMLGENAQQPFKRYDGDAGWDLFIAEDVDIPAHTTKDIHTNIFIDMPPFLFGRIVGRSSTIRKHNLLVNEGIIDNGYTGELFICVHNLSNTDFHAKQGMRLAQIIFHPIEDIRWSEVDQIKITKNKRGNNGFGSTGE